MDPAALGIVPRTRRAELVAVGGPPDAPRLLYRGQVELVGDDLPGNVYHAAAVLDLAEAEALIERWAQAATRCVGAGIANATAAAAEAGYRTLAVGIVGEVRHLPPLAAVLRSHQLQHSGEGQLSREAAAEAAAAAGLTLHHHGPRESHDPGLDDHVAAMGRAAGPPWRKEHKLAAVAALTALAART